MTNADDRDLPEPRLPRAPRCAADPIVTIFKLRQSANTTTNGAKSKREGKSGSARRASPMTGVRLACMRLGMLIAGVLACAGCEGPTTFYYARSEPITGPDGRGAILITCIESIGRCYIRAGRVCPNGYATLDAQGLVGSETESYGTAFGGNGWAGRRGHSTTSATFRGTMLIRCRAPSAAPQPMTSTTTAAPSAVPTPTGSSPPQLTHDPPF